MSFQELVDLIQDNEWIKTTNIDPRMQKALRSFSAFERRGQTRATRYKANSAFASVLNGQYAKLPNGIVELLQQFYTRTPTGELKAEWVKSSNLKKEDQETVRNLQGVIFDSQGVTNNTRYKPYDELTNTLRKIEKQQKPVRFF